MKKLLLGLLALCLLSSCAVQTKYEVIKDPSAITEVRLLEYLPIYSSYLPEPISIIFDSTDLIEFAMIINRATKSSISRPMKIPEGDNPTFDNSLYIISKAQEVTMIYVYSVEGVIYLTDVNHLLTDTKEYVLFMIQKEDAKRFNEILQLSN